MGVHYGGTMPRRERMRGGASSLSAGPAELFRMGVPHLYDCHKKGVAMSNLNNGEAVALTFVATGVRRSADPYQKLPRQQYVQLYADQKRQMFDAMNKTGERSFQYAAQADISDRQIGWKFIWLSDTAAGIVWVRFTADGTTPESVGQSMLLTRLDAARENASLMGQKANPGAAVFNLEDFDAVAAEPGPVVATFFTTDEAVNDSLIHAMLIILSVAFFDQFGIAPPKSVVQLKVRALAYVPVGDFHAETALQELILPDEKVQQLLANFRQAVKSPTGFRMGIDYALNSRQIVIDFCRIGTTGAWFGLSLAENDKHVHTCSMTALLAKLDDADDRAVMEDVRTAKVLHAIDPQLFDEPLSGDEPVAAIYFADAQSAHFPPIQTIAKLLSIAFFSQFGIGQD